MNRFRKKNQNAITDPPEEHRPLREFNHGSSGSSASMGKDGYRAKLYWSLFGLLGLSMFLFVAMWLHPDAEIYGSDEVEVEGNELTASSVPFNSLKVPELLNAYLNALGGRQALAEVRSVRYEGQVTFPSGQSDFQMLLLRPDKGMLLTNPGKVSRQKLMLNGDTAWRVIEQRNGAREVVLLDEDNTASLKWSFRVHNTLRRMALEGRHAELSVKEIEYMDKPCYQVKRAMPDGSDFLAVLNKETLYLLKLEEVLSGGKEKNKFTIVFDDHRMVSGVVEPYKARLYKNEKLDNEVNIRSIQINSGVISSLFKIPDELLD